MAGREQSLGDLVTEFYPQLQLPNEATSLCTSFLAYDP